MWIRPRTTDVLVSLCVFAILCLLSPPLPAEDWPHWRGPNSNGISTETGWNLKQGGKSGTPVLWKTNVGTGYCTVSVASGRLFTMGHRNGEETLYCFDAETGEEKWKHTDKAQLVANLHKGGPASTPTVEGESVYAVSRDGRLMALEAATGKPLWEQSLTEQTKTKVPEWGFSSSVVIEGNQLLVESGGIASFDKTTGKLNWHAGPHKVGYGSPAVFTHESYRYAASLNNQTVQVVNLVSGEEVASSEWLTSYDTNSTTPIVSGDEIFISTGYGRGCELLKFDGHSLKQLYEAKSMANHMNNSVLWEGHLYGVSGNSHTPSQCALRCVEWKTGQQKWSQRGCGAGSLILSDGKLIVLSDRGQLAIVKATPTKFDSLAEQEVLTGECWTSPVLANGRIYCRSSDGDVVCLDVK